MGVGVSREDYEADMAELERSRKLIGQMRTTLRRWLAMAAADSMERRALGLLTEYEHKNIIAHIDREFAPLLTEADVLLGAPHD